MRYEVRGEAGTHAVSITRDAAGVLWVAVDDGQAQPFHGRQVAKGEWRLDGETRPIGASVVGETVDVAVGGDPFRFDVVDARRAALGGGAGAGAGEIRTQMPGAVVRVLVAPGDSVTVGQAVIVVEAMKMENEFKADIDGVVRDVLVEAGETLNAGDVMVRIEEVA